MSEFTPEMPPPEAGAMPVIITHQICVPCSPDWAPGRPTRALCGWAIQGTPAHPEIAQQPCLVCDDMQAAHVKGNHHYR